MGLGKTDFASFLSVHWGFGWIGSAVHRGQAVRKFGKCKSKLKVLSCQQAIRQQGECNELCVHVSVCLWKYETKEVFLKVRAWMCASFVCVCVSVLYSHFFALSFHTFSCFILHTLRQVTQKTILMERGQNSLANTADLSILTTLPDFYLLTNLSKYTINEHY